MALTGEYAGTAELRDEIVKKINAHEERSYEDVLYDYDVHVKKISDEIVDQGRWETYHTAVYSVALNDETRDVLYFEVNYSTGSTEYQDLDSDGAEAYAVKPEQKIVTVYVKE